MTMEIFYNEPAEDNRRSNNSGLRGALQNFPPTSAKMTDEEEIVACKKVEKMLIKDCYNSSTEKTEQILSSIFIVPKISN